MTTAIHNTNTIAKLDTMISGHMDVLLWEPYLWQTATAVPNGTC